MNRRQAGVRPPGLAPLLLALALPLPAMAQDNAESLEACLLRMLEQADASATVGTIRAVCTPREEPAPVRSALTERIEVERETMGQPFVLTPHRPNYLIAAHDFSTLNRRPFELQFPDQTNEHDLQKSELKFQFSFKFPVVTDLFGDNGHLMFAYTNRSFWQAFNTDISSPFRDISHEPELWLSFITDAELLGFTARFLNLGLIHQSNGRAGDLSRSWNRVYAEAVVERGPFAFTLRPWWRLPESDDLDDNPDIEEYLGNFELQTGWKAGRNTFALMLRHNLDGGTPRHGLQFDWSFPIHRRMRGYVQYFSGYGESLIDYNARVNSVGAGVQLTDWF